MSEESPSIRQTQDGGVASPSAKHPLDAQGGPANSASTPSSGHGEEWVLVPRKVTPAMKAAVRENGGDQAVAFALAAWPDMLAAAPPAPASDHVGEGVTVVPGPWIASVYQGRSDAWYAYRWVGARMEYFQEESPHRPRLFKTEAEVGDALAAAPPSPDHAALVGEIARIKGAIAGAVEAGSEKVLIYTADAARLAAALHPSAEGVGSVGLSAEASAPSRVSDADSAITNGEKL